MLIHLLLGTLFVVSAEGQGWVLQLYLCILTSDKAVIPVRPDVESQRLGDRKTKDKSQGGGACENLGQTVGSQLLPSPSLPFAGIASRRAWWRVTQTVGRDVLTIYLLHQTSGNIHSINSGYDAHPRTVLRTTNLAGCARKGTLLPGRGWAAGGPGAVLYRPPRHIYTWRIVLPVPLEESKIRKPW